MDPRIHSATPRLPAPSLPPSTFPAATPAPAKAPEAAATVARRADVFETRSAGVAAVRAQATDPGKLMKDYLTGALPPPADFNKVMGYDPVRVETKFGTRMQDPFGDVSSPGGIGPTVDFLPMAKTHDYGYDLLRYYGKIGQPLGPEARKAADAQFREDLFHHANEKSGLKDRWVSRTWAQIYATAVELNSQRQNYGVP